MKPNGRIGHHEEPNWGKTVEWFTPPGLMDRLGHFDMDDPCLPGKRDGLWTLWSKWEGSVFLNPPYDKKIGQWLQRLADHGNGIALIFARTDTRHFFEYVWNRADAILFIKGRLKFVPADGRNMETKGNAGAPSCLVAYGSEAVTKLEKSNIEGKLIRLRGV